MSTWKQFMRNRRGAAAVEAALGIVVLVSSSALMFDVYASASRQAMGVHAAVTMADYVSREQKPQTTEIRALANVVHEEFFAQSAAAFIVFAVEGVAQVSGQPEKKPTVLWTTPLIRVGPDASTDTDLASCSQFTGANATALPLALSPDEIVVVAEVCVKQAGGMKYAHHILPTRSDTAPSLQS